MGALGCGLVKKKLGSHCGNGEEVCDELKNVND